MNGSKTQKDRLLASVPEWNEYRLGDPTFFPDLSGANLSGANLWWADLRRADLSGAVYKEKTQ